MNNYNRRNPKYVKHGNKKLGATTDTQPVKVQENYDVTLEVVDTATGTKTRMTERFHSWEKVRSLKDSFGLTCFRLPVLGHLAKLIIEEV